MPEKNSKFDTRLDQRNHKRKKNNILNILIGIVILLIIIVTVNIVTGDDEKESANTSTTNSEQEENTENESTEQEKEQESEEVVGNSTESIDSTSSNEETTSETEENESTDTEENEAGTVTTEPSNDNNVESVVIDSGWAPIGTEQSGNHVSSYDSNSVDWDEKVKALAYAANLDTSNMYVKFLGNGGSPQKSIGTVTSKDGSEIYRISIEWIDGEGWKPTKKEKLKTLE
ncbi:YrrS family protein [Psychrobacillus sp. INOP01]|uniref:YrrS family protein n=1 Tax=Psychrobacillus sp. INOP01 TaxID=2829187 RepID=UPI001BA8F839|nr:YrrS family protein [Psychrobacillus sp. INOP01]QUG42182.1 YrrS family protein [Psychrobacillus sp. INOP01]